MYCCSKCFCDMEIKAIIESANNCGSCDICGGKNVLVYKIDGDNTLADLFDGLFDVYKSSKDLPSDYPKANLDLLKNHLYNQWHIFNIPPEAIYRLITNVCRDKYCENPDLFDTPVGIWQNYNADFLRNNSILSSYSWNEFVDAIKWKSRFHINHVNKEILDSFIKCVQKKYNAGSMFYRARICSNPHGLSPEEMGAPPRHNATAGRVNPDGISVLYLADSEKTTLHEIRAGVYDYVAVAKFELLSNVEIVNLAAIDQISPFLAASYYGIDFIKYAVNIDILRVINQEIAKPLRRHDTILDYLPTQYISDFIKSRGYAGIEYGSTMCQGGVNIAFFDENILQCSSISVYEIESLDYKFKKVRDG